MTFSCFRNEKRPINLAVLIALLMFSNLSSGAGYYQATEEERQICNSMFGAQNWNADHICDCVRNYNRASRELKWEEIKYYAGESRTSCTYYMDRHNDPADQYYPVALMYRGMALVLGKDYAKAAVDLYGAIQRNPGLQSAYVQLSDLYSSKGDKQRALTIVSEGLKNLPASNPLRRRYLKLGGKEPFPEPYPSKLPPSPVPAAQSGVGNQEQPPRPAAEGKKTGKSTAEQNAQSTSVQPDSIARPVDSRTNPWCRFCPERPDVPVTTSPSTP